jgi:hypothetical protein
MVSPEEAAEIKQELADVQFEAIALSDRLEAAEAGQVKVVDVREVTAALMPMLTNALNSAPNARVSPSSK